MYLTLLFWIDSFQAMLKVLFPSLEPKGKGWMYLSKEIPFVSVGEQKLKQEMPGEVILRLFNIQICELKWMCSTAKPANLQKLEAVRLKLFLTETCPKSFSFQFCMQK